MAPIEIARMPLYIRHSDLRADGERRVDLSLCEILNQHVPNYIKGAQRTGGVWKIWTRSNAAREHLLNNIVTIKYKMRHIEIHDMNPFNSPQSPTEKITLRDLPMDMPSDEIIKFFEDNYPYIIIRSEAIRSRIPSRTNNLTTFYNGDRVVYVKEGFFPVLPREVIISGVPCKIWHPHQELYCKRCDDDSHRTIDTHKCPAFEHSPESTVFKFDDDPRSNYYPCDLSVFDHDWKSVEQAYQWRKMADNGFPALADEILKATSGAAAKNISNRVPEYNLPNWSEDRKLEVMRKILKVKLTSCEMFRSAILSDKDKPIIEGTVHPFWGAGIPYHLALQTKPTLLPGRNELGKLLGALRDELLKHQIEDKPSVSNSVVDNAMRTTHTTSPTITTRPPPESEMNIIPPATPDHTDSQPPSETESVTDGQSRDVSEIDLSTSTTTSECAGPTSSVVESSPISKQQPVKQQELIVDNDYELFPLSLLCPGPEVIERRRPRLRVKHDGQRSSSVSKIDKIDTSDMRPIVEFFSLIGKRKATDTSPTSTAAAKINRTDTDDDSSVVGYVAKESVAGDEVS